MSNNKSRDPLLYIQQPHFSFPKADMQQTYLAKKEVAEAKRSTSVIPLAEVESKTQTRSEPQNVLIRVQAEVQKPK